MLKILDKYILKKFLGTFGLTISLFILIAVVFDISEKIDDFDQFSTKEIIVDYYFAFIPWLYNLLTPLLVFIAVIFFTSKMANSTEIIPILTSGISFNRFLRPYFIGASILFLLALFMSHFLIPISNVSKIEMEQKIYSHSRRIKTHNIHREIKKNTYIYVNNYSKSSDNAFNFRLEKIIDGKLTYRFFASNLKWDHKRNLWVAKNWNERYINGSKEILTQGSIKDTTFSFNYKEFHRTPYAVATMDFFDIQEYIAIEKARGSEHIKMYEEELVKRTSNPFSIFILVLIGVCISSKKIKGGTGMHLVKGIGLALIFVFLDKIANVFAVNTPISTSVALWIPNILFSIIAIFIYRSAHK